MKLLKQSDDFTLALPLAVSLLILIWAFVFAFGNFLEYALFLTPFLIAAYVCLFLVSAKTCAFLYLISLFIGVKSYGITTFGNIMLSDLLFPGFLFSLFIKNEITQSDIYSPIFASLLIFCSFAIFSGICGIPFMLDYPGGGQFGEVKTKYIAVLYIFRFIQLPAVYLFVIDEMKRNDFVKNTLLICILFQMFVTFLQIFVFSDSSGDTELNTHISGTLDKHHMFIALYMMTCIPLLLDNAKKSEIIPRTFWAFAAFYAVYVIVVCAARSVLLGLMFSFTCFILFNIRLNKKGISLILISLLICLIVYKFTPLPEVINKTLRTSHSNSGLDMSSFSRLFIWKGALNAFVDSSIIHKIIGNGPGSFAGLDLGLVIWKGTTHSSGAHNNFLHLLVETGIVGLVLFLIHFAIIIFQLLKQKTFLPLLFVCTTIGLLVSGLPQETFWMQKNYWMFYAAILGCVVCEKRKNNSL